MVHQLDGEREHPTDQRPQEQGQRGWAGVVCPAEQRVLCVLSVLQDTCAGCRSVPCSVHGRAQGAAGITSADGTIWRSLGRNRHAKESSIKKSELICLSLRCVTASAQEQLWAFLLEQKNVICSH